ncbi:pyridoxal kinase [Bacteroides propionicifaciens]|uniref:pyridoxal kinase n=1 Tax=Bacteroides propionicifaciens TaxID=392838 RepID=UPI0003645411|nr:pyridoxal kinase [Bacteroides propionicifaciens]
MKNKILSIQSKLVYGYVGSNIAELAIQLHGLDVIAYPTVYLSAHTGHQPIHGAKIPKHLFDDLIVGIDALDLMDTVSCIVTGYIGSEDILLSAANYISRIKADYPEMLYICDPVMGDFGVGLYVDDSVAKSYLNDIIPLCDILTPNHFEFEYIIGHKIESETQVISAIVENEILRHKIVIITSCHLYDTADSEIETLIILNGSCTRIAAKRIDIETTGTGDLFSAIIASKLALGYDIDKAVREATQIIKKALDYTVTNHHSEMNAACLLECLTNK